MEEYGRESGNALKIEMQDANRETRVAKEEKSP